MEDKLQIFREITHGKQDIYKDTEINHNLIDGKIQEIPYKYVINNNYYKKLHVMQMCILII